MISFICPICESPGACRLEERRQIYCARHQVGYDMAYCHECGEWVNIDEEPIMAEHEVKRVDTDRGLEWFPYCSDCRAQLMPKDGQAKCMLCQKTWDLTEIDATIVELEERPPMPADALPVGDLYDEPEATELHWVTGAQLAQAETMYHAWMDEYHSEPNADRNLSIEAATRFLAQLLAEQHVASSQSGIDNTFVRWRTIVNAQFQQILKGMQQQA